MWLLYQSAYLTDLLILLFINSFTMKKGSNSKANKSNNKIFDSDYMIHALHDHTRESHKLNIPQIYCLGHVTQQLT